MNTNHDTIPPKQPPFHLEKSLALITGGGTGIGLGLANEFTSLGCKVIITGRNQDTLNSALQSNKNIIKGIVSDASNSKQREELIGQIISEFPSLNILVNNAGVQHRFTIAEDKGDWDLHQQQIDINLSAPLHYTTLLLPHLLQQPFSAIINITSGAAFIPPLYAPAYGATKAAIHHYTLALRASLSLTNVRVVEIVPPAVKTQLGGSLVSHGVDIDTFCHSVVARLVEGEVEIGFAITEEARLWNREQQQEALKSNIQRTKPKLVEQIIK